MTKLSLTDNDLLTGNAAECWKYHHRGWSDDSINCPKCDTPTGELGTDTENPYFIIDLDTGVIKSARIYERYYPWSPILGWEYYPAQAGSPLTLNHTLLIQALVIWEASLLFLHSG